MATLILGGIGAAVGSSIGGPSGARWGWAIGTVLGSWIDRPNVPDSDVGKLSDLKLSGSSYDTPFPRVKGKAKVPGCLVWVKVDADGNHLVEHTTTSGGGGKGGGGGGSVTSYTYSATFAVAFAEGVVFNRDFTDSLGGSFTDRGVRIKKIYADDQLVWEDGASSNIVDPAVYDGTEAQSPDATIASTVSGGSSQTCAHRGLAYAVFTDMDLSPYGNRIPNMTAVVETSALDLAAVYTDFATEAGLLPADLELTGLTDPVTGFVELSRRAPADTLETLCTALGYEQTEVDGQLKPVKRGSSTAVTVPAERLGATTSGRRPTYSRSLKQTIDLPSRLTVNFFNSDKDLQAWSESDQRQTVEVENARSLDFPMAMTVAQGKQLAASELDRSWLERHGFTAYLPVYYLDRAPGDALDLPMPTGTQRVRIVKMTLAPFGEIEVQGVLEDSSAFTQSQSGTSGGSTATNNPVVVVPSVFVAWSGKELRDVDQDSPGFYVAAAGGAGWRGGTVWYSLDGGTSYVQGPAITRRCVFGASTSALSASGAVADAYDDTNTVDVDLSTSAGELSSVTDAQIDGGQNQAVLGDEIIGFGNVSLASANNYTLSHILRGERSSTMSGHTTSDLFVVASSDLARVSVGSAYVGSTVKVKVLSPGETLADVTAVDVTIAAATATTTGTFLARAPLADRLRRAATKALAVLPDKARPLTAPPAHAGSSYNYASPVSQVGLVVDSSGQMYQLCIAGVTGTGTAPTGTDEKLLYQDGSCWWRYMGVTDPAASDNLAPVVTNGNGSAPTGLTNYLAMSSSDSLEYVRNEWANYVLNRTGYGDSAWGVNATLGLSKTGNVTTGDATYPGLSSVGNRWTIVTDCPEVGFRWHNGARMARVYIDGVPLWHGANLVGATATGDQYLKLDWSASDQRKIRTITIELPANCDLMRVYYSDYGKLFKHVYDAEAKVAFIGDSLTAGANGMPYEPGRDWPTLAAELLGWCWSNPSGIGGTGISNPGSNWVYEDRILPDLFGIGRTTTSTSAAFTELGDGFIQPDVVVVCGSPNDYGQSSLDVDSLSLYNAIRAQFSGPIIWVGIHQTTGTAGTAATYEDLMFSKLPTDDDLLFLVPVSTTDTLNPQAWFIGTGHSQIGTSHLASITGALTDNNPAHLSDDGTHLNPMGKRYYAHRFAEAVRARVLPYLT